jgi:monofunctional biosynthetic peptidoglycan transglycosylase
MAGRRRKRWGLRILFLTAISLFVLLPALLVFALRGLPPPTTAFIWAHSHGPRACPQIAFNWVAAEQIPSHVALAMVAGEDQRFWMHRGFDMESIREALEERMLRGRVRGASTISQQVTKNLFLWNGRSWVRKALEAYLTVYIEILWPKRRILEMYLNVAQFGPCTFGVGAASQQFFSKPVANLEAREAALLAAVLPNPRRRRADAPTAHLQRRADDILADMGRLQRKRLVQEF